MSKAVRGPLFRRALWLLVGAILGAGLVWVIHPVPAGGPARQPRVVDRVPAEDVLMPATGSIEVRLSVEVEAEETLARLDGRRADVEMREGWVSVHPAAPLRPGPHTVELELLGAEGSAGRLQLTVHVREPELLYLAVAGGRAELVRTDNGERLVLAQAASVLDYASSPDGDTVAYAAANEAGGADVWVVDRRGEDRRKVLTCGSDRCSELAWSPQEERLALARHSGAQGGGGSSRIWTLDLKAGQAAPLYQDSSRQGTSPRWSPDGRWLSFYDPGAGGLVLLDLDTVREQVVPSGAGLAGTWSPDGSALLVPVLIFREEAPITELHRVDPEARVVEGVLTEGGGWDEVGVPAWSPDGEWVAVTGRRGGSQGLWRVRPDGEHVTRLAGSPSTVYGAPAWDPWGERLVFQRFALREAEAAPELVVWPGEGGEPSLAVEAAASGSWLP